MNMPTEIESAAIRGYALEMEVGRDERFVLLRARRRRDRRSVLIKRPLALTGADAARALLQHEAELLASLPIDAIVRVVEFMPGSGDGSGVALVLEDHGGKPLASMIAEGRLALGWVLDYALQLVAVLAELHRCGVLHRALRPQAILVEGAQGRIRLADFSEAIRLHAAAGAATSSAMVASRLVYAAPEQTGRAGRDCDRRTDFYSLGVVLYELLSGRPPFESGDPLALIHAHMARLPTPPAVLSAHVPLPLSQIVMKLLAKAPDERYQSALALQRDLQRCRQEWSQQGRVLPFTIAQRDVPEQFSVPQQLYGRDRERALLRAVFERARRGRAELLLVSGYAGVGKTSLIRDLQGPVALARGQFVSGKFDQLGADAPYRALVDALRQAVRRLLAEPAPVLARRRAALHEALGDSAGAVAALIPELAIVMGEMAPLPALPAAEANNRLTLALQNFIACLTSADQPLVIFLDDLQWADAASLHALRAILVNPALAHLLLIGAYRDNEAGPGHDLLHTGAELEEAGVRVERIDLAPLALDAVTQLTCDTLQRSPEAAAPLAALLLAKAAGNPFFTTQLLVSLHQEGLITFDAENSSWHCQLDRIAAVTMAEDVAELMSRKIHRLAPVTREVLTLAACIGHRFDARTLAVVSAQTPEATASDLAEAAIESLIVAEAEHCYAFLHDRVQQAAYACIDPEQRPRIHLSIGRLLLAQSAAPPQDDALFDIVSHLNHGAALIDDAAERVVLARLNLQAGGQAQKASAFEAARGFFRAGISMLAPPHWDSQHALAFELHFAAAQCEYLCGDFDRAEDMCTRLLGHAADALARARVQRLRMAQLENMARYEEALSSAREALLALGVALPEDADGKQAALAREVAVIESAPGCRSAETIAALVDLPVMTDARALMVMSLLTDAWSAAYILGDAALAQLISATLVRLTLDEGQCAESAYGYVTHAILVGPGRGDYASAHAFGCLALEVNQRFDDRRLRAKIQQQFHAHVNLWCRPIATCIGHARDACRSGLAAGDFLYAAFAASTESWPAFASCQNLADCVQGLQPNLALLLRLKNQPFADVLRLMMSWALALQGKTEGALSFTHGPTAPELADGFDEAAYRASYRDNPFFTLFHAIARLQLCVMLDDRPQALAIVQTIAPTANRLIGMIWRVWFDFWGGLALIDRLESAQQDADGTPAELQQAQSRLALLGRSGPDNFQCLSLILDAELDRIAGRHEAALRAFEDAIAAADRFGNVQHQALARERFALHWLRRDSAAGREIAAPLLRAALQHYADWGAMAKVQQLRERHGPWLAAPPPCTAERPTPAVRVPALILPHSLDLTTVVKAAHAIAESVEPEQLLERLLAIAIENVGAQRGVLIEDRDGRLMITAEGGADGRAVTLLAGRPLADEHERCSRAVVDYVTRTRAGLVLADAARDERFAHDATLAAQQTRSLLCLPIVHQGSIGAIVYLENNLARDAFDPQRIELIQVLMAQGAISLANARLAQRMRQEMSERERAEATLRAIEAGTASVIGADFFRALARNLARALHVRYAFVAECHLPEGRDCKTARSRAFWRNGEFGADFEYEVPGTPCHAVLEGQMRHHADGVQALFPSDRWMRSLDARCYLGMPLTDSRGTVIGHMAVIDTRPMPDAGIATAVMRLSAGRAGAELERLRAAEGQQRALAEIEVLKNRLQAENVYLRRELIANVSHDLRSPLASLRGYLETLLLKRSTLSADEREAYLGIALRQTEQLQQLIAELFDLARLDFEGYRIEAEALNPGELARDVAQKFQLAARQRGVDLSVAIDPEAGFVRADIALIERTLSNLIDNALAHTPDGGRVVLALRRSAGNVELSVSDSGGGIAAEDLPRIFERFYRADKSRSLDRPGSGLGLAIVKRIVELHASRIQVCSEPGRGTRFWFELPLAA